MSECEPGIYYGSESLTDDEYFALPYASKSRFWDLQKMPETVRTIDDARAYTARDRDSYALTLGRAFDDAICDPEHWEARYVEGPTKTPSTKAWKKAQAESETPLLVASDFETIKNMVRSLLQHDVAGPIITYPEAKTQVVIVWDDPTTGIRCKGKIDMWSAHLGRSCHIDFKTWSQKRPGVPFARAFGYESCDYGYDVQAAHYLDGVEALRGGGGLREFLIIAVNKAPESWKPELHAVHVARYRRDSLEAAIRVRDELLVTWMSIKDGSWKPGPSRVHELETVRDYEDHHANTPLTREAAFL